MEIKNGKYEKEGVYYTPSRSVKDYLENPDDFLEQLSQNPSNKKMGDGKNSLNTGENKKKNNKNNKNNKNKNNKPQKSRYPTLMAVTVILGIVVFAIVFIIVKNSISSSNSPSYGEVEETAFDFYSEKNVANELSEGETEASLSNIKDNFEKNLIGMVRAKSDDKNQITLYDISDNSIYVMNVTGSSDLRNLYGQSIVYDEIQEGDIVDFKFDKDKNLISLSESKEAFEEGPITNFTINTKDMKIKKGTKEYIYSDATKFLYNDAEFEPTMIDGSVDSITLKGYNNMVWTVVMENGHSEIKIEKNDKIKNGIIEIDTNIYKKLSDADIFKVKEGKHKIVVKGDNIESFSKEINLAVNESYTVDLSEVTVKEGTILIKTNVTDYALYINDKLELSREPLTFPYGEYSVKILKDGYTPFETQVKLHGGTITVNAQLSREVKLGTLTVTSVPSASDLYIDGTKVGTTPYSTDLPQGEHTITLKKEGYKDTVISSIYITEKETQYNVTLQPQTVTTP